MRTLLITLFALMVVFTTSCKKEDSTNLNGLYNTDCGTSTGTAIIEGDQITYGGGCTYGTAYFVVSGNSISIPYQKVSDTYHQANGTITPNSFTMTYRVTRGGAMYVFKLKGVK